MEKNNDLILIGNNLSKVRKDKRLTHQRLSELSNVDIKDIKKIESGESTSVISLLKLTKYLGVKVSALLLIFIFLIIYTF